MFPTRRLLAAADLPSSFRFLATGAGGKRYDQFVKRAKLDNKLCQVIAHRASPTPAPRSRLREFLLQAFGGWLALTVVRVRTYIHVFEE